MAKLIGVSGVSATFAQEAGEACKGIPHGCGSMVSLAVASLGYFAENAGRTYYECPFYENQNLYTSVDRTSPKMATAAERFASAVAAAILNCGPLVGNQPAQQRLVGIVHPPRRFFVP